MRFLKKKCILIDSQCKHEPQTKAQDTVNIIKTSIFQYLLKKKLNYFLIINIHVYKIDFCIVSDINECLTGTHNCSKFANCTNLNGSFSCSCISGYQGNGVHCYGNCI